MYNRYIPETAEYRWIGEPPTDEDGSGTGGRRTERRGLSGFLGSLLGDRETGSGLAGLLNSLRLSELDTGDVLMLVIAGLLLADGKDVDLGIALILVFLFGFGEKDREDT